MRSLILISFLFTTNLYANNYQVVDVWGNSKNGKVDKKIVLKKGSIKDEKFTLEDGIFCSVSFLTKGKTTLYLACVIEDENISITTAGSCNTDNYKGVGEHLNIIFTKFIPHTAITDIGLSFSARCIK